MNEIKRENREFLDGLNRPLSQNEESTLMEKQQDPNSYEITTHPCLLIPLTLSMVASPVIAGGIYGYGLISQDSQAIDLAQNVLKYGFMGSIGAMVASESLGYLRNRFSPQGLSERMKIVDELEAQLLRNPDMTYFTTDHFIISYKGRNIYRKFGNWLDTNPAGLAMYLEGVLPEITNHFEIELPNTFQVVNVMAKDGLNSLATGGLHFGESSSTFSNKRHKQARFNRVYSANTYDDISLPSIYQIAIHEAIGHGYIGETVLPEVDDFPFLIEGIATYVQKIALGINVHAWLREYLFTTGWEGLINQGFKFRDDKWLLEDVSEDELLKAFAKSKFGDFPVIDVFKLDPTEKRANQGGLNPYIRGSSFIKYFIDGYGIDTFKAVMKGVNGKNFVARLTHITGRTLAELEEEWKYTVLSGSYIDELSSNSKVTLSTADTEEVVRAKFRQMRNLYYIYT